MIPIATKKDFEERNRLRRDPDCMMEDEQGKPAKPWQIELCRRYRSLLNSRRWVPTIIEQSGKYGLWDQFNEELLVPARYDEIGDLPELAFSDDCFDCPIPVRLGDAWGMVFPHGNCDIAAHFRYQEIKALDCDIFRLKKGNRYGIVHFPIRKGLQFHLPCIADNVSYNTDTGLYLYQIDGKLGIAGVTQAEYDRFEELKEENGAVIGIKDGEKGYITKCGDFIPLKEGCCQTAQELLHCYYCFL